MGSGNSGRIVIPAGADWTLKGTIPLRSGVQLVGARGPLGERPVLRQAEDTHPLFTTEGANDVRIEGLQLIGPRRTKDRFKDSNGDKAIHVQVNPGTTGHNIRIVDNEIDHWSVAVGVDGDYQANTNREYDALCESGRCPKLYPKDAGQVRVERNYIHENVAKGGGYGVVVGGGAYATIEANVFEYNNHSIAASGRAFSGYVARYNYVLRGSSRSVRTAPSRTTSTCTAAARPRRRSTSGGWPASTSTCPRTRSWAHRTTASSVA